MGPQEPEKAEGAVREILFCLPPPTWAVLGSEVGLAPSVALDIEFLELGYGGLQHAGHPVQPLLEEVRWEVRHLFQEIPSERICGSSSRALRLADELRDDM